MEDENWTTEDFITWGKYLIAAIENDWECDVDNAISDFTDRYGRRDCREYGECNEEGG